MCRVNERRLGLVVLGMFLGAIASHDIASTSHRIAAHVASGFGDSSAADWHLRAAVDSSRASAAEALGENLLRLGTHYRETGRLPAASAALEEALAIYPDDVRFDPPRRSKILLNLIDVYQGLGRLDRSLAYAKDLLRLTEGRLGADHLLLAGVLDTLAIIHSQRGDLAIAEQLLRRALAIRESHLGSEHPEVSKAVARLGWLVNDRGDPSRARLYLDRGVALLKGAKDKG